MSNTLVKKLLDDPAALEDARNLCANIVTGLWKRAQKNVDVRAGGLGVAPITDALKEYDRLRVSSLQDPSIEALVWSLETIKPNSTGFLAVLPSYLTSIGALVPHNFEEDTDIPEGTTIH